MSDSDDFSDDDHSFDSHNDSLDGYDSDDFSNDDHTFDSHNNSLDGYYDSDVLNCSDVDDANFSDDHASDDLFFDEEQNYSDNDNRIEELDENNEQQHLENEMINDDTSSEEIEENSNHSVISDDDNGENVLDDNISEYVPDTDDYDDDDDDDDDDSSNQLYTNFLMSLDHQTDYNGPVAVDQQSNDKKYKNQETQTDVTNLIVQNRCSICLESFCPNKDHYVVCLPCGHLFGKTCIEKWLASSKYCPTCRFHAEIGDIIKIFLNPIDINLMKQNCETKFWRDKTTELTLENLQLKMELHLAKNKIINQIDFNEK